MRLYFAAVRHGMKGGVCRCGQVEGQVLTDILLDTGCSKTLVRRHLIPEEKLEGDAVTIRCANEDTVLYPVAEVTLEVDGFSLQIEAAVSETLPILLLLGTDAPMLGKLLGKRSIQTSEPGEAEAAMVVMSRAQAWRGEEEAVTQDQETAAEVQASQSR